MSSFEFELPAVRGVQSGRPYFVTACPLRLLCRLFSAEASESPRGHRHQAPLNPGRVQEIARYVTENSDSYVFGALAASVDAAVAFDSDRGSDSVSAGKLRIPMSAQLVLHDGHHRCAALVGAVRDAPKLADETIALVIFVDPGLKRTEQMFNDLKRHERRLPKSLIILHDDRDEYARLTREVIQQVDVFGDHVEMVRTTISHRSRKLFTLSAIYQATRTLLAARGDQPYDEKVRAAATFWKEVSKNIPAWRDATQGKASPADLRRQFIHTHGIALAALGRVGQTLLVSDPQHWKSRLRILRHLDWSRSNSRLWEGRAMIAGRLSKASSCVVLTANAIKQHLKLPLSPEEERLEQQFSRRGTA